MKGQNNILSNPETITSQKWVENRHPLVSICCSTFNHEKYIRDAIEGFLMQKTTFPVEILIHDDASSDGTADIIREYEKKHPDIIKPIYQTENQYSKGNKPGRINRKRARGKYIALCEGDDYWTDPLKLQKQVDFLEKNPEYTFVVGGFIAYNVYTGTKREVVEAPCPGENYDVTLEKMYTGWITKTLTAVYRKDAIDYIALPVYKYSRDVHLFYHLAKAAKGYYLAEVLGVYHIHENGIYSVQSNINKLHTHYTVYKELYKKNRDEFSRIKYFKSIFPLLKNGANEKSIVYNIQQKCKLYFEAITISRTSGDIKKILHVLLGKKMVQRIKKGNQ